MPPLHYPALATGDWTAGFYIFLLGDFDEFHNFLLSFEGQFGH